MRLGKEALVRLVPVLAIPFALGCASGGPRRPAATNEPAPVARAQTPAPDLRIPGPAASQPTPLKPKPQAVVPAAPPNVVPASATAPAPADPMAALRALGKTAAERYAAVDSYIVRLRRREQIGGKDQPEELMLFKFRKEPWGVHMKWVGEEARGREVVFVKGHHGDKLHTKLAAGDVPLMPAGKRMALDPNSPLVRSSSRHPITQAGVGNLIERFSLVVAALEKGDTSRGTLKYLGPTRRPEFPQPCEAVEQAVPPGRDATPPQGGRRWWFFDPHTRFPTLMITHAPNGHQVEYYFYDQFQLNVRLDEKDFNPDLLWGK